MKLAFFVVLTLLISCHGYNGKYIETYGGPWKLIYILDDEGNNVFNMVINGINFSEGELRFLFLDNNSGTYTFSYEYDGSYSGKGDFTIRNDKFEMDEAFYFTSDPELSFDFEGLLHINFDGWDYTFERRE